MTTATERTKHSVEAGVDWYEHTRLVDGKPSRCRTYVGSAELFRRVPCVCGDRDLLIVPKAKRISKKAARRVRS